jgi:hypothetical protein
MSGASEIPSMIVAFSRTSDCAASAANEFVTVPNITNAIAMLSRTLLRLMLAIIPISPTRTATATPVFPAYRWKKRSPVRA